MSRPLFRLAATCVAFSLTLGAAAAADRVITDATGRQVTVGDVKRVIAVGGSTTEIVYALGLADRLVAVDTTSMYPADARKLPNVGYMRALSAEGVLAMRPDLVLAQEGSGPADTLELLKQASVPVVIVPDKPTPAGIVDKIRFVANAFGVAEDGSRLAARVEAQISGVEAALASLPSKRKVIFVMSVAGGRPLAAGSGTAADGIIRLAGAQNAAAGFSGYKPLSDEAVTAAAPDAVLVMTGGGQPIAAADVFGLPAFKATPAAVNGRLISMDGLYLLGFGPRTAEAVRDLARALYPELDFKAEKAAP